MQTEQKPAPNSNARQELTLIPMGIALNLALAWLIYVLKLPIYLDAVGTVLITLIAGLRAGVIVGVASFLIGGITFNPVLPYFCGTQAMIAVYVHIVGSRGGFRTLLRTILSGIGLGIVAGIVSAPVIAILFGGLTGNGVSLVSAFFLKTGQNIFKAVLLSGLAAEPIDKTLQCLLAFWLLKGVPQSILSRFQKGSLIRNAFIKDQSNARTP